MPEGDLLTLSDLRGHIRIIPDTPMTMDEFLRVDLVVMPWSSHKPGFARFRVLKVEAVRAIEFDWWPFLVAALPSVRHVWQDTPNSLHVSMTEAAMLTLFFSR